MMNACADTLRDCGVTALRSWMNSACRTSSTGGSFACTGPPPPEVPRSVCMCDRLWCHQEARMWAPVGLVTYLAVTWWPTSMQAMTLTWSATPTNWQWKVTSEIAHCADVTQLLLLLWECNSHLGARWASSERFHHFRDCSSREKEGISFSRNPCLTIPVTLLASAPLALRPLWLCPLLRREAGHCRWEVVPDLPSHSRRVLPRWWLLLERLRASAPWSFLPTWTIKFPMLFFLFSFCF